MPGPSVAGHVIRPRRRAWIAPPIGMQLPTGDRSAPHFGPLVDLGWAAPGSRGPSESTAGPLPGVTVVARLDAIHLPFRDSWPASTPSTSWSTGRPAAVAEIHRVCVRRGVHVEVPYFAVSAYADPTHRAWFTYTTFEHFGPPVTSG